MIEASRLEFQRRKTYSVGPSLQTLNEQLDIATGHPVFVESTQLLGNIALRTIVSVARLTL